MRLVEPDDYVLHFIDNSKFTGVSKVSSKPQIVQGIEGTKWEKECYLFNLQGCEDF